MSLYTQLFGGGQIKSIQRGVLTVPSGSLTAAATITAVDQTKAELDYLGCSTVSSENDPIHLMRLELTNGTTVTAYRNYPYSTGQVSFQVVEYY